MRKRLAVFAAVLGMLMAMSAPVSAAELHPAHVGTYCEWGFEYLHFVNNQTGGAEAGEITVDFGWGPGWEIVMPATKVNRNVQHFWLYGPGLGDTLVGASTDLDGRLVLSDYGCNDDPYYGGY